MRLISIIAYFISFIMKKFLLFAVGALLALPMITSCSSSGPTGDPKKDAESLEGLLKKQQELDLEFKEKQATILEYYADKKDSKEFEKFLEEFADVAKDVENGFEKDNRDKIKELNKTIKNAQEKLEGESSSSNEEKVEE